VKPLLLALVLLTGGGAAIPAYAPNRPVEHAATFWIGMEDGSCSGAAIGPNLVISAAHCFEGGPVAKIGGRVCLMVGEPILDGNDHAIFRTTCAFRRWALFGGPLKQGQELHWWGNPLGLTDLYRKGYVMGYEDGWTLVDANVERGDSGSAIFDKHGRIVSVVSTLFVMGEFSGMGCKPFAYTREQLEELGL